MVELQFVDSERSFELGERIRLQAHELYDTIVTLWRFGLAATQSVEAYGKGIGIQFPGASEAAPQVDPSGINEPKI